MDKSEDLKQEFPEYLEYPEYQKERKEKEDEITDHKYHTHIQMGNSHWQLRLSHHPTLKQHSSWPLWLLPNNTKTQ